MQTADGGVVVIAIEINRALLDRLGCQTKLCKLPRVRVFKALELGRLDIFPGAFRHPEREGYAYFFGLVLPPSRNILFMCSAVLPQWPIKCLLALQHTAFR